jgi:hypothetical protein
LKGFTRSKNVGEVVWRRAHVCGRGERAANNFNVSTV